MTDDGEQGESVPRAASTIQSPPSIDVFFSGSGADYAAVSITGITRGLSESEAQIQTQARSRALSPSTTLALMETCEQTDTPSDPSESKTVVASRIRLPTDGAAEAGSTASTTTVANCVADVVSASASGSPLGSPLMQYDWLTDEQRIKIKEREEKQEVLKCSLHSHSASTMHIWRLISTNSQ